jgi:kinesin family member 12
MNSFYGDSMMSNVGGERVKVALRVRPMMIHENSRGDESIVNVSDNQHAMLSLKTGAKSFRFNAVLDETTKQSDVFNCCGVHVRIKAKFNILTASYLFRN